MKHASLECDDDVITTGAYLRDARDAAGVSCSRSVGEHSHQTAPAMSVSKELIIHDATQLPSTSSLTGLGGVSETHPEMSSIEWFDMLREKAKLSRPSYHVEHTPPSSPEESPSLKLKKQPVKRSRVVSGHAVNEEPPAKKKATPKQPENERGRPHLKKPAVIRQSSPDRRPYTVSRLYQREIKKFKASEEVFEVCFKREFLGRRLVDMMATVYDMFEDVLNFVKAGRKPQDRGRVYINHPDLHKAVVVHLRPLELLTPKVILERLENVLQSMEELKLDEAFQIKFGIVEMPAGGGGKRTKVTNLNKGSFNNSLLKKRSVIQLPYDDKEYLCCARSLVICKAHKEGLPPNEWKSLIHKKNHMSSSPGFLRQQAKQLQAAAGLPIGYKVTLSDLCKFENVMDAQIIVLGAEVGSEIIYSGEERSTKYFLFLELEAEHYSPILKPAAFLGGSYYCEKCMKPYTNKNKHKCLEICKTCKNHKCTEESAPLTCRTCNRQCRSLECFQRHKTTTHEDMSICNSFKRCLKCLTTVNLKNREFQWHKCGESYCKHCEVFYMDTHMCYVQVAKPKKTSGVFFFFDCESTMDNNIECENGYSAPPQPECMECHVDMPCRVHARCNNCKRLDCGVPRHTVNYVVCQSQCNICKDRHIEEPCAGCGTRCSKCDKFESKKDRVFVRPPCKDCGQRQTTFSSIESFGEFIFKEQNFNTTVLSHNGGRYDEYFLLSYALKNSIIPSVVYAGSRIMSMHVKGNLNIRFLDSYSFLPMPLKSLPKAFGMEDIEKGEFPYFFNTKKNINYVGAYPPPEMYGVDNMSTDARRSFLEWHSRQSGVFDMKKEIHKYCVADVTILRQACAKFRDLMFEITKDAHHPGLDVFSYSTIASVCMNLFRSKFLEQKCEVLLPVEGKTGAFSKHIVTEKGCCISQNDGTVVPAEKIARRKEISSAIARMPVGGYAQHYGFSKTCCEWLEWESIKRGIEIQHAGNSGEVKIGQYKVDGFHRMGSDTIVFEFNGCVWHGCKCIKKRDILHPYNKKTMDELLAQTAEKERRLREWGYQVVSIWECQWREQILGNPDIAPFLKTLDIPDRLNPREAFFGGRTSPFKMYYEVKPGEKVRYVDFTSLYPWVNKYCRYPVGHPHILMKPAIPEFHNYFGFAKVTILPPRNLYFPVLPVRLDNKLIFPLCLNCARVHNQNRCTCTDEQRMLKGTWCTPEIQLAISKGNYNYVYVLQIFFLIKRFFII